MVREDDALCRASGLTAVEARRARTLLGLLPILVDESSWRSVGHTRAIAVHRVLALPWNPSRFRRALDRLEAGERAPAVHVSRYHLPNGDHYYLLADGFHRTSAARALGRRTVRAVIESASVLAPERFVLENGPGGPRLWRSEERGLRLVRELTEDEGVLAAQLGAMRA